MKTKDNEHLYSEEISLITSPEYEDYVRLNLRKIKEFRRNFKIPVIGIAGAEGKTTTKRMLSAIISRRGEVLETPLDCDSASVITSTLLKLNQQHQFAILELGIINRNQFNLAVDISEPNIGLVTNIGEAQMAALGDKYILADAKVELIRKLPPTGFAVLNIDDDLVSGMDAFSPTPQVIKFGFNGIAHFHATDLEYLGPEGMKFKVNNYYPFHLPIYGSTSVSNAMAAISVARILGLEFDEIKTALEEDFQLLSGRGNLVTLKDFFVLDHTYNATINAVSKSIESLVQFKKFSRRLMLILGDLENLSPDTDKIYSNLGYYLSAKPIDTIVTVGLQTRLVAEGIRRINHNQKVLLHCEEPEKLPDLIMNHLSPHTTILMTGGKSLQLSQKMQTLLARISET